MITVWLGALASACGDHLTADANEIDVTATGTDVATLDVDATVPAADADSIGPMDAVVPDDSVADAVLDADPGADTAVDAVQDADAATDAADAEPDNNSLPDAATSQDADSLELAETASSVDAGVEPTPCTEGAACVLAGGVGPCHVAVCLAATCTLLPISDGSPCDDGDLCTYSDVCLNGQCNEGVKLNCDDGEPCTADTCAQGGCAHAPASGPCDDGNACTQGDACKNSTCAGGQPLDCEDGNVCTDKTCDPATGCLQLANTANCTLLDLCQTGAQCGGGTCHAGASVVCADGNPCTNDLCDPQTGLCQSLVTTTPCDDGDGCTLGDLCHDGQCQPGAAKVCDDGSPCTSDSCDAIAGTCLHTGVDAPCDDGSSCTVNDLCLNGVCLPGAPTSCDDGNPCTDDTCGAQSGCSHSANTLACSLGDVCELAQCQSGQCLTTGIKGCDDGNPCTVDNCVTPLGCVFKAGIDGQVCAVATPCEGVATCAAGKCSTGAKTDCSDGNTCTEDHCDAAWPAGCYWLPKPGACEDGDLCTGQDVCDNGKCRPGTLFGSPTDCNDGNLCTDDSCNAATGCVHVANAAACDDGNGCTIFEQCLSGVCQGGALATCEDGNSCTLDMCAPVTGICSWSPKLGGCDDGNPCTVSDTCAGATCVGVVVACDDGNPCSADACNAATGVCGHTATGLATACSDGDACTTSDVCVGMTCSGVSIASSVCGDGNVCTVDICDPVDGTCTWTPATGPCADGNPCTIADECTASVCVSGSGGLCDDQNACTIDTCDPTNGACSYGPAIDGAACDDGLACTSASACMLGFCAPAVPACTLFADTFTCGGPYTGWALPQVTNTTVVWAVDQSPLLPNSAAHGCMLNYNDGVDYCSDAIGFYCAVAPTLVAVSPTIDATNLRGMPRLAFDTWYQLDGPLPGGTGFGDGKTDVPFVVLRDVVSNQVLDQFLLSKSNSACNGQCQSIWRTISLDEPKVVGHTFRIELSLASPSNWGNQGKGWFVDNIKMTQEFTKESCVNGVDDDGNGRVDCADPACIGAPGC